MYYNQSIKEPGDLVEEDDEISQENPLEEVKRVLLKDEGDSAKKTIDDADLGIQQNPNFTWKFKSVWKKWLILMRKVPLIG